MQEVHLEESLAEQQQLGSVQAKERQREALVQEAVEAVGTFPSSASSPCGLCSPAPTVLPSRFKVSLTSQPKSWVVSQSSVAEGWEHPSSRAESIPGGDPAPAGGRAGDEGGRPQRARSSTGRRAGMPWLTGGRRLAWHSEMLPPAALGTREAQ